MAAQLARFLKKELSLWIETTVLWTDCSTVLTWLNPVTIKSGNRVTEIQELTENCSWCYVDSTNNPADDLARLKPLNALTEMNRLLTPGSSYLSSNTKNKLKKWLHCTTEVCLLCYHFITTSIPYPSISEPSFLAGTLGCHCKGNPVKLFLWSLVIIHYLSKCVPKWGTIIGSSKALKPFSSTSLGVQSANVGGHGQLFLRWQPCLLPISVSTDLPFTHME